MDPIHPILPQKANIPPVSEPTRIGRIDRRDPRRDKQDEHGRPKNEDAPSGGRAHLPDAGVEDKPGLHIDVTA